jgi:hypothetical protein
MSTTPPGACWLRRLTADCTHVHCHRLALSFVSAIVEAESPFALLTLCPSPSQALAPVMRHEDPEPSAKPPGAFPSTMCFRLTSAPSHPLRAPGRPRRPLQPSCRLCLPREHLTIIGPLQPRTGPTSAAMGLTSTPHGSPTPLTTPMTTCLT